VNKKKFLFLQGVCSPFFLLLADQLRSAGHQVFKVNFNAGDVVYWGFDSAFNYRGSLDDLGDWIADAIRKFDISDLVLFGDQRPIHRPSIVAAQSVGIRSHVFEEGYFRPYWITLEREGVNACSLLPRDPDWFLRASAAIDDLNEGFPFKSNFKWRAIHDVAYHLAGMLNFLCFPKYKTHAPVTAPVEYASYIRRKFRLKNIHVEDNRLIYALGDAGADYYVLPLQMDGDAQIRYHSRFRDMCELIDEVMCSFVAYASLTALLVIKNHPLDTGLVNFEQYIKNKAIELDVAARVLYIEGGDLNRLLHFARGCVTVNSTVGCVALAEGCPTITLSDPIYNIRGLTYQQNLDSFWQNYERPDADLFNAFRRVVIHTSQVNGGFYCKTGITLAVVESAKILSADISRLEELITRVPLNDHKFNDNKANS
jgi:capsular polysaccharide export protein